ncbi:MAG TPA: TRL-like family protein [Flavobacteriaceae bacterium]|nr:TRL-like family protein [Flavobacteriaceae bacterium]
MKTLKKFIFLAAIAVLMSSCSATVSPVMGILYTDAKSPVAVTSNANSSKVGTAEATSILGLVGTGDASIEKAAKSAGITKIHHVDQHGTSILGIYAKYTVYVYGE